MDEDKAFAELEQANKEKIDFGAEAEAFILNAKGRHIIVEFSNTRIKVKPALPRSTSLKIGKLEARAVKTVKKYEDVTEETITEELIDELSKFDESGTIAEIVSELCLEYPFNNKGFWLMFDEETEQLSLVYNTIIQEIADSEKKITEFRKDR